MLFTSSVFILFFLPILLVSYFIIPSRFLTLKNLVLLGFSLVFYAWGGVRYFGLLLLSIAINYIGGVLLHAFAEKQALKRLALIVTLVLNLGLLGVFKYAGFVAETIVALGVNVTVPNIVLPIGISFFTFQGLSYVVDVYRGDAAVQKNPLHVALYIALFPQLVAGPIVRYTDVEKELTDRRHTLALISYGVLRFMLGFGKKMILANPMGEIADGIFAYGTGALLTTPLAWVGAIAYTFQIYFDFSAYSDMAIGLGKIFGFHFNENFNYPYISASVTEFWRRWHISLSSWFRDYLYIPLGGNRCSVSRTIFNLSVVWLLTGLWHGASWNFVFWGVYYGILLILEKYVLGDLIEKIPAVLRHLITMLIVVVGWVFFRAENLGNAVHYLSVMFGAGGSAANEAEYYVRQFLPEIILCFIGIFPIAPTIAAYREKHRENALVYTVVEGCKIAFIFVVFLISFMKLISGSFNPFIYFQF